MSTDINLTVESRDVKGTAASRRLRHADKVPGIIYGAGKGNENILFAHSDIMHRLDTPAFYSSIISLRHRRVISRLFCEKFSATPIGLEFCMLIFSALVRVRNYT